MKTRQCTQCKNFYSETKEFFYSNGPGRWKGRCKNCYKPLSGAQLRARRRELGRVSPGDIRHRQISREYIIGKECLPILRRLQQYKLRKGCKDCGYNKHAAALEFDHLKQYKKCFNLSNIKGRTFEEILSEVKKCDVVCANCHRLRTHARNGGGEMYSSSHFTSPNDSKAAVLRISPDSSSSLLPL